MARSEEETIEHLHRRERDAMVAAAKSKTVTIASVAALGGLVVGVFVTRDLAVRFRDQRDD